MTKLKEERKKKKYTQSELAEKANQSVRYIQNLEQGRASVDSLNLSSLIDIANALEVCFVDLIENDDLRNRLSLNYEYRKR